MTQLLLAGRTTDDVTSVDLARIVTGHGQNGQMLWRVMEKYNDVAMRVGMEDGLLVIDLGHELPKSSRSFYYFKHYTNDGADALAKSCPLVPEWKLQSSKRYPAGGSRLALRRGEPLPGHRRL